MNAPLQQKAMLAQLSISQWNGSKLDKKVTNEVEATHGAHKAGRFTKQLVDDKLLKPITEMVSKARKTHYHMTLSWSDDGKRILPSTLFLDFTTEFRTIKTGFDKAVDAMVQQYPIEVQAARNRLGTMYNPGDYPDPADIKAKFGMRLEFEPIPDGADFRVDIGAEAQEELQQAVMESVRERQQGAVKATYARIRDVVSKIEERLSDPEAKFHDTLITNAIELCQVLDGLNITNDPIITNVCKDMRDTLLMPPSLLKSSPSVREKTAAHAARILQRLPS
jgi:hypothetical protein